MTRKVYVLDAAAIFTSYPLFSYHPCYTTSKVVSEILDSKSREALELSVQLGKLVILDPERKWVSKAIGIAKKVKTLNRLSKTDISIVALALKLKSEDLEPIVLSDDYKLQYTLKSAGIEYSPVKSMGIDRNTSRSS